MRIAGLESLDDRLLDGLDFCNAAYNALDAIRSDPHGISELRLRRTRRAKKLLEEVLPLAAFIQGRYRPGCRLQIRWIGGNQSFDARVIYRGPLVDWKGIPKRQYLEVTTAVQQTEYLVRERLDSEGGSFTAAGTRRDSRTKKIISVPVVYEHADQVAELAALICNRVADKASRDYPPATSLLVHCDLGVVVLEDEWEELVRAVRALLRIEVTRFQEVVLVHHANRLAIVATRARKRGSATTR